jgi:hypothetical protein
MPRNRLLYALLVAVVLGSGLIWRSRLLSLTPFLTKYGGDALWALMVFFAFGFLFRSVTTLRLVLIALIFAWAIEFSQLYHAPWIDTIRAMRIGRLILGSTFNWPDLPAYVVGIMIGALVDRAIEGARKDAAKKVINP